MAFRTCLLLGTLSLLGCAEELSVPDAVGIACEVDADCEVVAGCGRVLSCLAGRCEDPAGEPALVEPCGDTGRPADPDLDAGI